MLTLIYLLNSFIFITKLGMQPITTKFVLKSTSAVAIAACINVY